MGNDHDYYRTKGTVGFDKDHEDVFLGKGYKGDGYALMYDLVRDMPKAICDNVRTRFGGFRFVLLWLHSFQEPFFNTKEMGALGKRMNLT